MPGPNEGGLTDRDLELLTSKNIKVLFEISPGGIAQLDQETNGAASSVRDSLKNAMANRVESVDQN